MESSASYVATRLFGCFSVTSLEVAPTRPFVPPAHTFVGPGLVKAHAPICCLLIFARPFVSASLSAETWLALRVIRSGQKRQLCVRSTDVLACWRVSAAIFSSPIHHATKTSYSRVGVPGVFFLTPGSPQPPTSPPPHPPHANMPSYPTCLLPQRFTVPDYTTI